MDIPSDPPTPATPTAADMAVTVTASRTELGDLMVHLAGELDCWSGTTLAAALVGLSPPDHVPGQHPAEVVLDLHELSFLDGSGLRALEAVRHELLEAGWLVTAGPAQPQVHRLLRYADRAGWLTDGPLTATDSSTALSKVTSPQPQPTSQNVQS